MSDVTVHVGLTFAMGAPSSNQYGRLDITFSQIDPEQDVNAQISGGLGAARKAFEVAIRELDSQVEAVLSGKRSAATTYQSGSGRR